MLEKLIFPTQSIWQILPISLILLFIPVLVIQYRRYGAVSFVRLVMVSSFVFYLIVAFLITILPLPSLSEVLALKTQKVNMVNLIPFNFLSENIIAPGRFSSGFTSTVFVDILANILVFIPLGFYIRYYFQKSFRATIYAALVLSLFFEITQFTGIYGVYPYPYRVCDVDDVMLNVLGAMIGDQMVPYSRRLLPNLEVELLQGDVNTDSVGLFRRLLALLIDWSLVIVSLLIFVDVLRIPLWITGIASILIVFVFVPEISQYKQTIGMRVLKICYDSLDGSSITLWEILVRNLSSIGAFILIPIVLNWLTLLLDLQASDKGLHFITGFIILVPVIFFGSDWLLTITKTHRTWYERLSGVILSVKH